MIDFPEARKPRYRWHRLPKVFRFLFFLPAAICWAFGHSQTIGSSRFFSGIDYDLFFFALFESFTGDWFFTWL